MIFSDRILTNNYSDKEYIHINNRNNSNDYSNIITDTFSKCVSKYDTLKKLVLDDLPESKLILNSDEAKVLSILVGTKPNELMYDVYNEREIRVIRINYTKEKLKINKPFFFITYNTSKSTRVIYSPMSLDKNIQEKYTNTSIVVTSDFYNDWEFNFVDLVFNYLDNSVMISLNMEGNLLYSKMSHLEFDKYSIILDTNVYSANIILKYYYYLFSAMYSLFNNDIVDYSYIENIFCKSLPSICIFGTKQFNLLKNIWKFAKDDFNKKLDDSDFTNIYAGLLADIYNDF